VASPFSKPNSTGANTVVEPTTAPTRLRWSRLAKRSICQRVSTLHPWPSEFVPRPQYDYPSAQLRPACREETGLTSWSVRDDQRARVFFYFTFPRTLALNPSVFEGRFGHFVGRVLGQSGEYIFRRRRVPSQPEQHQLVLRRLYEFFV